MNPAVPTQRRDEAVAEFDKHEHRTDGGPIVNSLCYGLTTLRNVLFNRIHQDVEKNVGRDSMMMPISILQSEEKAKQEIEIFQVAASVDEARRRTFVRDVAWYAGWLGRLRLGEVAQQPTSQVRLDRYLSMTDEERRLGFSRVLEKTFPEATRAPLVLYRLFPFAVGIATALAFRDLAEAAELRSRQASWLPAITDCHECRGRLLENGEQCTICGNPVWTYTWLTAAD
jgi:hypothetical protein